MEAVKLKPKKTYKKKVSKQEATDKSSELYNDTAGIHIKVALSSSHSLNLETSDEVVSPEETVSSEIETKPDNTQSCSQYSSCHSSTVQDKPEVQQASISLNAGDTQHKHLPSYVKSCIYPAVCINAEPPSKTVIQDSLTANNTRHNAHVENSVCDTSVRITATSTESVQSSDKYENPLLLTRTLYPSLKTVDHDIAVCHSIVQAYAESLKVKTNVQASKSYQKFIEDIENVEGHEFYDLVKNFEFCRKNYLQTKSKMNSLTLQLNKEKENLWVPVTKKATAQGKCDDGNAVDICHAYIIKEFSSSSSQNISQVLQQLDTSVISDVVNYMYVVEIITLQIQHYIGNILQNNQMAGAKTNSSTLLAIPHLKICVSSLFSFQRRAINDECFLSASRKWLEIMVVTLLKIGTIEDHAFVLNHILRCPSGISKWAASFVQIPATLLCHKKNTDVAENCRYVEYALMVLYMLLSPVPNRDVFLRNVPAAADFCTGDSSFVVLDSDGEEMSDFISTRDWTDEDVISLLNQISFVNLFEHIFHISLKDEKDVKSDTSKTEEVQMKIFALEIFLLDILFSGLQTYNSYNRVIQEIGDLIRYTVQFVSAHWKKYKAEHPFYNYGLQSEYDRIFFHTVYNMFHMREQGGWNILAHLEFSSVSPKMLWNLLWMFHSPLSVEESVLYAEKDVDAKFLDGTVRRQLQEKLQSADYAEVLQFLKMLENMTLSRMDEKDFTSEIIREIFETSILNDKFNSVLAKGGQALIFSIIKRHPFVMSSLLKGVVDADNSSLSLCIPFFKEIPLNDWIPTSSDMDILSDWLLVQPLSSEYNQISRIIIGRLNWGFKNGQLVLPLEVHRQVALLVVEAYVKYDADLNKWSVSRGVKQMLQLCASIYQANDSEQNFVTWSWELLFSLKLHVMCNPNPPWIQIFDGNFETDDMPDTYRDPWLQSLMAAYDKRHPVSCFLVLAMTSVGHSLKCLKKEGLDIIANLIEAEQYAAAIQALYFAVPFFAKDIAALTSNKVFMSSLSKLILADQSWLRLMNQEKFVGAVLDKIASMIKLQIFQAWSLTVECASPLLKLWISLLVKLFYIPDEKGSQKVCSGANQIYYLLDSIIEIAFTHEYTRNGILEMLSSLTQPEQVLIGEEKKSLWNLLFGKTDKQFFILSKHFLSSYTWFSWAIIFSEANRKATQDLWLTILEEMSVNKSVSPDAALKSTCSHLNVPVIPLSDLPIYRWSFLIINTSHDHPLLPLMWQQFFLYYFQRTSNLSGLEKMSISYRFFKAKEYSAIFLKMQGHLKETIAYLEKCSENQSSDIKSVSTQKKEKDLSQESHRSSDSSRNHQQLLKIYQAFYKWIVDDKLHDANLCLSALDPNYLADKLKLIIQNDQQMWVELIQFKKPESTIKLDLWHQNGFCKNLEASSMPETSESSSKDMSGDNKKCKVCPLPTVKFESPTNIGNGVSFWNNLTHVLRSNQKIIFSEAKKFDDNLTRIKKLNDKYMNLLPYEYRIKDDQISLQKSCFKLTGKCAGPAKFKLSVKKSEVDEKIQYFLEHNRTDFLLSMGRIANKPSKDLAVAAVQMEVSVRSLIQELKTANEQNAQKLRKTGISLFYMQINQVENISLSLSCYESFKHCFTSCLELLGSTFIEGQQDQLRPLAEQLLNHSVSANLASSFFNPNIASVNVFTEVYQMLVDAIVKTATNLNSVFVLLSKVDISKWLINQKVSLLPRQELFKIIGRGLLHCGTDPSSDILPIYELLQNHFLTMFKYQFPDHYGDAVYFLLNGTVNLKLCVNLWYKVLKCMGYMIPVTENKHEEISSALQKYARNQLLSADQQCFVSSLHLSLNQIFETITQFHRIFMKIRGDFADRFFKEYKLYSKPVALFLGMVTHSLTEMYLEEKPENLNYCIKFLWHYMHLAFEAWVDPWVSEKSLIFPWQPDDFADVETVFKIFVMCINFQHQQLEKAFANLLDKSLLSYVWDYYVQTYVKPGIRNYSVTICHSSLILLPWDTFHPDPDDIKGMCEVLQCEIPESREFLAKISIKIPWVEVITKISENKTTKFLEYALGMLAKLVIISGWENAMIKNNIHRKLLKSLEILDWHLLTTETAAVLLDLYSSRCNSFNILKENTDSVPDVYILKFLKVVCGLIPSTSSHISKLLIEKPKLYINKYVNLVSSCVNDNKTGQVPDVKSISAIIPSLLNDIETIILKDVQPADQINAAIPLVKETFELVNNINDTSVQQKIVNSTVKWLSLKSQSVLLLPCIKSACCVLKSMNHLVSLVECCIASRFNTELKEPKEAEQIWYMISSCINVPDTADEDFLTACISQNSFLTMYVYICQRLACTSASVSKVLLLQCIVKWNKRAQPDNMAEGKMMLLWDKVLELSLTLSSEGNTLAVQNSLSSFCSILSVFGEDRHRSGLLGAVGLGKQSSLSLNFRFLSRALAAFISMQIPDNGSLRLESMAPGHSAQNSSNSNHCDTKSLPPASEPRPSPLTLKALENVQALSNNKYYAALKSQVDYSLNYIINPRFCLLESRHLLKELALQTFPNETYLHALGT